MKKIYLLHIVFLLLTVFSFSSLLAQDEDAEEEEEVEYIIEEGFEWEDYNYIDTTRARIDSVLKFKKKLINSYVTEEIIVPDSLVELREFNNTTWQKYKQERDYLEAKKKEEKAKEKSNWNWPNFGFEGLGFIATLFKFLMYAVIVLGIGFAIFKLLEAQYKQDSLVRKENAFLIQNLEEKIHDVDLYKLLNEYKQKQDYKMLIRIYYLIVIKEMSNAKLIQWEIQKTNGNYLQEMFNHKLFEDFKKLTLIFERVWFGEVNIDAKNYEKLELLFEIIIQKIKGNNTLGNK